MVIITNEDSSDKETLLGSWKLGGAAKHLIDRSKKCICQLSFEFWSPQVIERLSKYSNILGFWLKKAKICCGGIFCGSRVKLLIFNCLGLGFHCCP